MYLNIGFFIIDPGNDAQTTVCCSGESRIGQANISDDLNDTFSNTYNQYPWCVRQFFSKYSKRKDFKYISIVRKVEADKNKDIADFTPLE
jgi:hypothetical protein